jgi:hypothetical protein
MIWEPITEAEIWEKLNASWKRMNLPQRRLWEVIRIDPVKWNQTPYGDESGGFWVVAILGNVVIWFNDIEDGFNRSKFTKPGIIDDYWCNQDELEWTIQHVLDEIKEGHHSGGFASPPKPVA